MDRHAISITAKRHGNTIYIVEHMASDAAKETAFEKVKRLILNQPTTPKHRAS